MWRTLEHTADVAFEVEADGWRALLEEAARAFGSLTSNDTVSAHVPTIERVVETRGMDRVEVWVNYWRGLLRLWTVEGVLPATAKAETSADGLRVRASIACVPATAIDSAQCLDVKAVTWHDARIERREGSWTGIIVLDL